MYSFILFITLTVIETIFILWKWSDIKDYQEVANSVASASGLGKQPVYQKALTIFGNIFSNFKSLLFIPIALILVINLIISIFFGSLTHLIVSLF
tara:strand:+ start:209916 stop:210200 length:285 start_codon:yes stop_codon:yes gene_type:complete